MNELTFLMFGKCAMFFCAFSFNPDTEFFEVRVNNTETGVMEITNIAKSALFLEQPELECLTYKKPERKGK